MSQPTGIESGTLHAYMPRCDTYPDKAEKYTIQISLATD